MVKTLCRLVPVVLVTCFLTFGQEARKELNPQISENSSPSGEILSAETKDEVVNDAVRSLLIEADRLSDVDNWSHAIEAYSRAAQLDPNSFEAQYSLGLAYLRTNQHEQAVPPLQQATKLSDKSVRAWNLLGLARYRLEEFNRAAHCFARATEAHPRRPAPFNNLGHSYLRLSRYSAAQQAFNSALQIDPNFGRAVTGLCIALANTEPLSERGANICRKAVVLDPNSSSANYLVGYELLNRAHYREAAPYFQRAVELEPSTGLNYLALGRAQYGIAEFDQAFKNLSRAVELQPNLPAAYTGRGAIYFRKRKFKQAIEEFKRAVELDPDSVDARYNLGVACFAQGDRDCALQQYNRLRILTSPMADKLFKQMFRNRILDARTYAGSKANHGSIPR